MFKREEYTHPQPDPEYLMELMENGIVKRYLKGRVLGKGGFA
jgi:hypothetical protein